MSRDKFKCLICATGNLMRRDDLLRYLRMHNGIKPFMCDFRLGQGEGGREGRGVGGVCGLPFATDWSLDRHKREVHGEKKTCDWRDPNGNPWRRVRVTCVAKSSPRPVTGRCTTQSMTGTTLRLRRRRVC